MNAQETITTALQSKDIDKMLISYQNHTGNQSATLEDLFEFLTFPSSDREEFLQTFCTCNYQVQNQIVSLNYLVK